MTQSREKILDKITKLLRLAESSNPHEAERARQRAETLKRKHEIGEDELVALEARRNLKHLDAGAVEGDPYWQEQLALAVAGMHGVRALKARDHILFEGGPAVADALSQYRQIKQEISDLAEVRWKAQGDPTIFSPSWCAIFSAEAVRTITEHLTVPEISKLRAELAARINSDAAHVLRSEPDLVSWLRAFVAAPEKCAQLAVERAYIEGRRAGALICAGLK